MHGDDATVVVWITDLRVDTGKVLFKTSEFILFFTLSQKALAVLILRYGAKPFEQQQF